MERGLLDEWLFQMPGRTRVPKTYGPVRKSHLAFLLQEGALDGKKQIYRPTEGIAKARFLADYVEEWKDESIRSAGGSRLPTWALCSIRVS